MSSPCCPGGGSGETTFKSSLRSSLDRSCHHEQARGDTSNRKMNLAEPTASTLKASASPFTPSGRKGFRSSLKESISREFSKDTLKHGCERKDKDFDVAKSRWNEGGSPARKEDYGIL